MVRLNRNGRVAGNGLRGGEKRSALSLPGSTAGAQNRNCFNTCGSDDRICSPRILKFVYDLTTYFEGQAEENPKATRSYRRDHRPEAASFGAGLTPLAAYEQAKSL